MNLLGKILHKSISSRFFSCRVMNPNVFAEELIEPQTGLVIKKMMPSLFICFFHSLLESFEMHLPVPEDLLNPHENRIRGLQVRLR